jgi:hypothetical protein
MITISFHPVYATTTKKACYIRESITFDSESTTASYEIEVDATTRPQVTDFVLEVNGEPQRASFEIISNDPNEPIYKAVVTGKTLSPIDIAGPDKFPFDRYKVDILIRVSFESDTDCNVNPPSLTGPLLEPKITVLSDSPPVAVSIELSRPLHNQLEVMGLAAAPLVCLGVPLLFKKKTDGIRAFVLVLGILSSTFFSSLLGNVYNVIPSPRTMPSYFELTFFATAVIVVIVNAAVFLRRR